MDSRARILAITGVTIIGGAIAYAAYFDHKRRNDADFRKKLRKEKKRVDKSVAQSKASSASLSASGDVSTAAMQEALEQIRKEEPPLLPEEREAYFMHQVGMGEQLSVQGPEVHLTAALSFYRALRVYPSPIELINIYEKTIPPPIFRMIMDLTKLDVQSKVEGYYEEFPPKAMNTHIESRGDRKVVVLNKDFAAGELIYKEKPVVAVLDADLQESGKYCAHCLRSIDSGMSTVLPEVNPILSTFCSKACLIANESQSHNLLFTLEPPLPAEFMQSLPPNVKQQSDADRKDAQEAFVAHIKKEPRAASLLVARFIARQVAVETAKLTRSAHEKSDFTDAEKIGSYMLADHLERLRFIDVKPNTDELKALVDILRTSLPGLEHFVTDDRHALLLGKMVYNAFGVCFGAGRDDKPQPTARPEDVEKTRTPYGTSRQIGSAFYTLSSYLPHSCAPNARPSFSEGTSELHLIANRDLKAGDELSVAYVDVTQKDGESAIECRRRRRFELARGWRFPCPCDRCLQESKELSTEEKVADAKEEKDGSKVEIHPSLADAEVE